MPEIVRPVKRPDGMAPRDFAVPNCACRLRRRRLGLPPAPADGGTVDRVAHRGNRRVRYRGVSKNEYWLHHRVAALNLRRLLVLGLTRSNETWVIGTA